MGNSGLHSGRRIAGTAILIGALALGSVACAKPTPTIPPTQTPTPTVAPFKSQASIDKIINEASANTLISIYGNMRAEEVAMYILVSKNTYGKDLHNASADLYLLDMATKDYTRLSYKFPDDVKPNSDMQPFWVLRDKSKLESDVRRNLTEELSPAYTPMLLAFIKSGEGIFEVKPEKYSILLWDGSVFLTYERTVYEDPYSVFKDAGVPIPKR